MEHILFLVHRIPYPPNKGDKIRSYHLLKHLAQHYKVHLGSFVDDPDDWVYETELEPFTETCLLRSLNPTLAKLKSLTGFINGDPLTLPYYRDTVMQRWVDETLATQPIKGIVVFSSAMARFLRAEDLKNRVSLLDFVDVDSDKWRQYSDNKSWPMSWVYQRESKRLLAFEQAKAAEYNASLFVTREESELFKTLVPASANRIDYYNNGVDTNYFSPEHDLASPYASGARALVFTGAMDYWANVEAVVWFAKEVLPLIQQQTSNVVFYIVGIRPTAEVEALGDLDGVEVTGAVPDVRPYIAHAEMAVVPLRIARGVQNKVLEAMAMGQAVVATPAAKEGIDAEAGTDLVVANTEDELAKSVLALLDSPESVKTMGQAARNRILASYHWSSVLQRVDDIMNKEGMSSQPEP